MRLFNLRLPVGVLEFSRALAAILTAHLSVQGLAVEDSFGRQRAYWQTAAMPGREAARVDNCDVTWLAAKRHPSTLPPAPAIAA